MTTLLLIRHGESKANREGFFAGQYDVELMPRGLEQAKKTAEYIFDKYAPTRIYSSDLSRAYNTAIPLSELMGADIVMHTGLREIYAGNWQKRSFDELETKFSDEYGVWLNDIGAARCNGGETVKELSERIMKILTAIAEENDGTTVAIATHATPIRAAQTMVEYGDIRRMKDVPWTTNGSVTVLEYNGEWTCASVSEDGHLGEDRSEFGANV